MKLIIAMIQPHKLPDVKQELYKNEIYKMTVTNVLGAGQQKGFTETYRGVLTEVNLLKKVRLEIAVNEDFVEPTIEAVMKGASNYLCMPLNKEDIQMIIKQLMSAELTPSV